MVPETGLEPAHLAIRDPKSRASANFATPASTMIYGIKRRTRIDFWDFEGIVLKSLKIDPVNPSNPGNPGWVAKNTPSGVFVAWPEWLFLSM